MNAINATNALEIRDLTKHFPGFSLSGLNLTLPSGCIMGLVGENGAGKSTTIRLILNMLHRDGGSVTLLGRDNQEDLRLTKEDVGVVLDEVGIPDCLNTRQVGKVMAGLYRQWDQPVYEGLLHRLKLPEGKAFRDFSRGMKMKLGIAIALSHHSRLLLLDEATSGLDPVARDDVVSMLLDFTRDDDHAVLISSHIVSDLERLCDYIAFLHQGKLLLCEEKDRLMETYGIARCTSAEADALPAGCALHRRDTAYGAELLMKRGDVPPGMPVGPVSIEELFVCMVKGANA